MSKYNAATAFNILVKSGRIEYFKFEEGLLPFSEDAMSIIETRHDRSSQSEFEDGFFVLKIEGKIYHEGGYKPPPGVVSELPLREFLNQFLTKQTENVTPESR